MTLFKNKSKSFKDKDTCAVLMSNLISMFTISLLPFCNFSVHKCTSVPQGLTFILVKLSSVDWYLCKRRCRRFFGWPVRHTASPRSEAWDWCSCGFVSEGPAHIDCYRSTTPSTWTSRRSLQKHTITSLLSLHTRFLLT